MDKKERGDRAMKEMDKDILEVFYSEEQLKTKVAELGAAITRDYQGKSPVLVSVLRGSYIFMADLTRAIDLPCTVDFMSVSSYGAGTTSSGQVKILKDLSEPIEGKDLIIVEDILDSGNTLFYLRDVLAARKPASIAICTLLDKPERRTKPIQADYSGFEVPDAFVVGYGLDYAEKYRNLPYIGVLKPEVYGG
jgi:hypoxanthine phosphoribosyltransferase